MLRGINIQCFKLHVVCPRRGKYCTLISLVYVMLVVYSELVFSVAWLNAYLVVKHFTF